MMARSRFGGRLRVAVAGLIAAIALLLAVVSGGSGQPGASRSVAVGTDSGLSLSTSATTTATTTPPAQPDSSTWQ